jgi:hypothetical protein
MAASYLQLSPKLVEILRSLVSAGGATPMQLEVQSGRIGEDMSHELHELQKLGLVESREISGGFEREMFYASPAGRHVIG